MCRAGSQVTTTIRVAMARSNIVVDLGASDQGRAGVISLLTMCFIIAVPIHFNILLYLR